MGLLGEHWRGGAAHTFTGVVKELHALARRVGASRGGEGEALYKRLAGLLQRDPGLAGLLGRRDVEVLVLLLEGEPRAWPWLGPALAAALAAHDGDGARRAWLTEAHAALLARGAACSLLQGPSHALPANLYLLEACVARPGVDEVVVVVNTARLLIKQAEEGGWREGAASLLATLDLLHAWRRPLATTLPGWPDSLQRWCQRLGQQREALPVLDKALVLLRDYLHEAPPQDPAAWLTALLTVTGEVHAAWGCTAVAPSLLVSLSSATASLTASLLTLLDAAPQAITQAHLRTALTQLLTLLDERGRPEACHLPGDTLHAVTACTCRLLDLAEPPLLLWASHTFSTPSRVLQAVEDAPGVGGDNPVVVEEARLVTALVRALSPFSVRVLMLALTRLGGAAPGEVPLLAVVAQWFCAVVASGLRLDPAACLMPPAGTPLLQVLGQHFHRRHDPSLLQVAAFSLLGGDTATQEARTFGEFLIQESVCVQDAACRGACTLVAFLCCPRPAFLQAVAARPPAVVRSDVAACTHQDLALHPKYRDLLDALAHQALPLLPQDPHPRPRLPSPPATP